MSYVTISMVTPSAHPSRIISCPPYLCWIISHVIVVGSLPEAEAHSLSAPTEAWVWPPISIGRATCLVTYRQTVRLVSFPCGSGNISRTKVKQSMAFWSWLWPWTISSWRLRRSLVSAFAVVSMAQDVISHFPVQTKCKIDRNWRDVLYGWFKCCRLLNCITHVFCPEAHFQHVF